MGWARSYNVFLDYKKQSLYSNNNRGKAPRADYRTEHIIANVRLYGRKIIGKKLHCGQPRVIQKILNEIQVWQTDLFFRKIAVNRLKKAQRVSKNRWWNAIVNTTNLYCLNSAKSYLSHNAHTNYIYEYCNLHKPVPLAFKSSRTIDSNDNGLFQSMRMYTTVASA